MESMHNSSEFMVGQLLVAMPWMEDPRFAQTVIYICAHNPDGAMGLVVNKALDDMTLPALLTHVGSDAKVAEPSTRIHFGGPVEPGCGFILHSVDYLQDSTLVVDDDVALTATVDILEEIVGGNGPRRILLALGYAGWAAGQLDGEIKANGWLQVAPDEALLFDDDLDSKWLRALRKLGVDPAMLSSVAGSA
jgi:putative transcriptional regulator